ncbi:adenylyl cyclase CyaB [Planctopirus limnophila DSM 3776]|uniref:Adenylyl cyclase CyaB n=1 Tax=Planctopirus limnophila (strain ATCC 43296 / DSM 3776 / IFAM 1008 / Mu 290) TaxID=521674 RepID=D5SPB4_PLAL2|nr:class IV adenylate cyclase [Planctopirus limnophila]ADG68258.1 adenylyl cyclase CyaB [Planctopirus limnophila DSM 3776]
MADIEVEIKFSLNDVEAFRGVLLEHEAICAGPAMTESDEYFAHPARDFATTGEALRVRSTPLETILTYKGPRLDQLTKTRHEIEAPLVGSTGPLAADKSPLAICQILLALGFRSVRKVVKSRQFWTLPDEEYVLVCTIDHVPELGHFAELEIITEEQAWQPARDRLLEWAARLKLDQPENRSYLELLLDDEQRPS